MLTTHELRWFYPDEIPLKMKHWFEQNCQTDAPQPPEQREDIYLYAPDSEFLGMKLRQGRLEIKWRQTEIGSLQLGNTVTGKVEKWRKWLCEDPTGESFQPPSVRDKAGWVSVHKVRYSQRYQVSSPSPPQAVPLTATINNGCGVELTQLVAREQMWWSVALEAFGEDSQLTNNLQAVAKWVFQSYQGLDLEPQNSLAYPSWLHLVMQQ